MTQIGGQVVLNGITDAQLIAILEVKEKHRSIAFNPQTMQTNQQQVAGQPPRQVYNNVTITWSPEGFAGVRDLMSRLIDMN